MVECRFLQYVFAPDPVHDLQGMMAVAVGALRDVEDGREEIVGLAIETQRVQTPQGEGGVADPGVSVVPIALASRGFRK